MADLSKDGERPALSPEGALRALGVQVPGSGLEWLPRVQLVTLADDVSAAQAWPALPEAGYGGNTSALVAGEFPCLEITAGRRGCWVLPPRVSGAATRVRRFDSRAVAPALLVPVVIAYDYAINGGVETECRDGTVLATSGFEVESTALISKETVGDFFGGRGGGYWLSPGAVMQFIGAVGVSITTGTVIREPLAAP